LLTITVCRRESSDRLFSLPLRRVRRIAGRFNHFSLSRFCRYSLFNLALSIVLSLLSIATCIAYSRVQSHSLSLALSLSLSLLSIITCLAFARKYSLFMHFFLCFANTGPLRLRWCAAATGHVKGRWRQRQRRRRRARVDAPKAPTQAELLAPVAPHSVRGLLVKCSVRVRRRSTMSLR
jgi:hypothetical protein